MFKLLIIYIFTFLSLGNSASAAAFCGEIFKHYDSLEGLTVVRFGYLPLRGRTVSGHVKDSIWATSILWPLKVGGRGWHHQISMKDEVQYYQFPMPREVLKEAEKSQNTQHMSQSSLEFVYNQFKEQVAARDVFSQSFIKELRAEDQARVDENLTVWTVLKGESEIVASWGMYRHPGGAFAGKIELIRLAASQTKRFSIRQVLPLVSEYLNATLTTDGTIMVRSDGAGSRLYRRLGAKEVGRYDQGKKVVLEIAVETFLENFPAMDVEFGNRPLMIGTILGENFIQ